MKLSEKSEPKEKRSYTRARRALVIIREKLLMLKHIKNYLFDFTLTFDFKLFSKDRKYIFYFYALLDFFFLLLMKI